MVGPYGSFDWFRTTDKLLGLARRTQLEVGFGRETSPQRSPIHNERFEELVVLCGWTEEEWADEVEVGVGAIRIYGSVWIRLVQVHGGVLGEGRSGLRVKAEIYHRQHFEAVGRVPT